MCQQIDTFYMDCSFYRGAMLNNQVFYDAVPCYFAKVYMDLLHLLPFQIFWVSISRLQHPPHWSRPFGGEQFVGSHL